MNSLSFQFFSQNFHFALNLLAGLVFFAVFWLYFDAWQVKKHKSEVYKWLGFGLLAASFLLHATNVEQALFGDTFLGEKLESLVVILRVIGYAIVAYGLWSDPLQPVPNNKGLEESPPSRLAMPGILFSGVTGLIKLLLPVGAIAAAFLYLRRATVGLERHIKVPAIAFSGLALSELLALAALLRGTLNTQLYTIVAPFGPIWYLEHLLLLVSVALLGKWVWQYLTTRILSQLFMTFTASTIVVFLVSTVSFSFLLMRNIQNDALASLQTAANVLNYAMESKKAEGLSLAEAIAQNSQTISGISSGERSLLQKNTANLLASKKQSSIIITNANGQVLSRAEDAERWGDSLSSDPVIRLAKSGIESSNYLTKEGVLTPQVYVQSASPVKNAAGKVIGVVRVELLADSLFLDGIKNTTGLDSALYAGNVRTATTFLAADGKTRLVGIREGSKSVNEKVLKQGQTYSALLTVLNRPTLGVYLPIKDAKNQIIGMLFVGRPQSSILSTAGRSVELTFLLAALLMAISVGPNYLIARRITKQVSR